MTDKQIIIDGGRAPGITTLREQLARLTAQYNTVLEQNKALQAELKRKTQDYKHLEDLYNQALKDLEYLQEKEER